MNRVKKKNPFVNGIRKNSPGDYTVRARVRVPGGKIVEKRDNVKTKEEGKKRIEEMKAEIRLENSMDPGDSISTVSCKDFNDLANYYESEHKDNVENRYLNVLKRDLGHVNKKHVYDRFRQYYKILKKEILPTTGKPRENKTLNHYVNTISRVFSYCSARENRPDTGVYENPFSDFTRRPTKPRKRVFRGQERSRLLEVMRKNESKLLYALLFCVANPVRQGDLMKLERSNIIYRRSKMIIKFFPDKTEKSVGLPCFTMWIPEEVKDYWNTLPEDCPWLFPIKNRDGSYRQMTKSIFNEHWRNQLKEAKIKDFHWHDLKHVAITYLRDDVKLSKDEIKTLGLQFSDKMIDLYYDNDPDKNLELFLDNYENKAA